MVFRFAVSKSLTNDFKENPETGIEDFLASLAKNVSLTRER